MLLYILSGTHGEVGQGKQVGAIEEGAFALGADQLLQQGLADEPVQVQQHKLAIQNRTKCTKHTGRIAQKTLEKQKLILRVIHVTC